MTTDTAWIDTLREVAHEQDDGLDEREVKSDGKRRRSRILRDEVYLSILKDEDGVIRLDPRADMLSSSGPRGRRAARTPKTPMEFLDEIPLSALPPSKVYSALEKVDKKLTPKASSAAFNSKGSKTGLRELARADFKWHPIDRPNEAGKILLLVHGTFSNNDTTLKQVLKVANGKSFLDNAFERYDQVLAYDHRTLGVSPILNARELALLFENSQAELDIICHSRGGLVARWFIEAFDRVVTRKKRVVFVGAPLAGTGLASPHNVRQMMELFANYASALGKAGSAVPFFEIVVLLSRMTGFLLKGVSKTPIVDAAIALVPGLDAMSRTGNNHELLLAQRHVGQGYETDYYSVTSNFEPEATGWQFWKAFRNPVERAKDWGADKLFDGENDLVVDTVSMRQLTHEIYIPKTNTLDYGTSKTVHHTNYFSQSDLYPKLNDWLIKTS